MNRECRGLPKEKLLSLIDECISGTIVYTEDVLNILGVYGDRYIQEDGSDVWINQEEFYLLDKELTLAEAFNYAELGYFVSSQIFSSDQSMHYWNGKFYYEDGAVVTLDYLESQDWATFKPWKIVALKHQVDKTKLDLMHLNNRGYMLNGISYMDVIKKNSVTEENL